VVPSRTSRTAGVMLALLAPLLGFGCNSDSSGPQNLDQVIITALSGEASPTVQRGESVQLRARGMRNGQEVSGVAFEWSSQTPALASVDNTGRVSGIEYGTAIISATPTGIGGPAGSLQVPVVGPPVAAIQVLGGGAFLDLNDTMELLAFATDAQGRTLSGVQLTWRSLTPNASVDGSGRVTGVSPGAGQIEVVAWNEVRGTVQFQVTPVSAMTPDTGRYGGMVRIEGQSLPVNAEVYFTGASATAPVRAFVRNATATAIDVWVPVGARTGPIRLRTGADSVMTSRNFRLTAQEDIITFGADSVILLLPFPFHNPSLLARGGSVHFVGINLEQPTPFSMFLVDRGARNVQTSLFFDRGLAFLETRDFIANAVVLDSVPFSRQNLAPGLYLMAVYARDMQNPNNTAFTRAYGLRLSATPSFQIMPDAFEPNDFPQEAPLVTLPFNTNATALENPNAMDYFRFDLAQPSTVTVTTTATQPWVSPLLLRGDSIDVMLGGPGDVLGANFDGTPTAQLQATLPAGRYSVLAWEVGGRSRTYSLNITAAPAQAGFQLGLPTMDPANLPGGRSLLEPRELPRRLLELPSLR
jgi:hypothetical protein